MTSYFDSEFFKGNRRRLRDKLDAGSLVVVTANGLLQRNGDATYKFRQDSNFWYLTGVDEPDVTLVMDGEEEYLLVPGRDAVRQAFDGAVETDKLAKVSAVAEVLEEDAGWKRLSERLAKTTVVHTFVPAPAYLEQVGMYVNPARERLAASIVETNNEIGLHDLREILAGLRAVKQPVELEVLQKAIDVTIDGLLEVASPEALAGYEYEFQAEADLHRSFKLQGASGHAFEPIIVAGKRACTLHNLAMDGKVGKGELLQFDVGAEVDHYAADISRAYAVGDPTERQLAVHAAVCDVQDYALSLLKPGVLMADYEKQVAQYMGGKLQELGLIKENTDENVRNYFPHATSHFLGLDVHDAGLYKEPLAPGMVVTCEPGIYIPDEAIGIRIEDDILITENGYENMSRRLGRELR